MRITSLKIKRKWTNRISYWLYDKFCREPYLPECEIHLVVRKTNPKSLNNRINKATISFIPKKFVPGIHEIYLDKNITIL